MGPLSGRFRESTGACSSESAPCRLRGDGRGSSAPASSRERAGEIASALGWRPRGVLDPAERLAREHRDAPASSGARRRAATRELSRRRDQRAGGFGAVRRTAPDSCPRKTARRRDRARASSRFLELAGARGLAHAAPTRPSSVRSSEAPSFPPSRGTRKSEASPSRPSSPAPPRAPALALWSSSRWKRRAADAPQDVGQRRRARAARARTAGQASAVPDQRRGGHVDHRIASRPGDGTRPTGQTPGASPRGDESHAGQARQQRSRALADLGLGREEQQLRLERGALARPALVEPLAQPRGERHAEEARPSGRLGAAVPGAARPCRARTSVWSVRSTW